MQGNASRASIGGYACGPDPAGGALRDSAFLAEAMDSEEGAWLPTQLAAFRSAVVDTFLPGAIVREFTASSDLGRGTGEEARLLLCRDRNAAARWRIVGSHEVFEPVDALSVSGAAMDALAQRLVAQGRPLDFNRVPATSPLVPALRRAMAGRGWLSVRPAQPRPVLTLPPGERDPLALFNAGRRSDFRRSLRRAEKHGKVAFEILAPTASEFEDLYAQAIAIEARSWKREAGSALAVDPVKCAFFREFLKASCAAGRTRIAFMSVAGERVAMQLALEWSDRFWLFKIGFDEAYRDCSPGSLLMLHTLGHAMRAGLESYELLGCAEAWIERLWTTEQLPCLRLRTYPRSALGLAALGQDGASWLSGRLAGRLAGRLRGWPG